MARTELPNGIILPAEYSDDWYDDMTSNLSKLDEVIGSDAEKLSAEDVGAAALSNDYADLDNKPDLNPYDQHLANTEIHVTAADKQKWNDNVSQSYVLRYASTSVTPSSTIAYSVLNNTDNIKAGDSVIDSSGQVFLIASVDTVNETVTVSAVLLALALDANVMHLSGNETAAGEKTFTSPISCLRLRSPDNSNAYVTFRPGSQAEPGSIILSAHDGTNATALHLLNKTFVPYTNNDIELGTSSRKWKRMNGLNPGVLSFPDLSSGLDISSYISGGSGHNEYTPLADGWISVILKSTSSATIALFIYQGDVGNGHYSTTSLPNDSVPCVMSSIPVKAGTVVNIDTKGINSYVYSAKFYPNLGNV